MSIENLLEIKKINPLLFKSIPEDIIIKNTTPVKKFHIHYVKNKLTIIFTNPSLTFNINFSCQNIMNRINIHRKKPNLIKSIEGNTKKLKLNILDMTAGFGYDAFTMAAYGHKVTAIESNIYIYLMLKDALIRCNSSPLCRISKRIKLFFGKSQSLCNNSIFDIVYIDPMFLRKKKSAKVKKHTQILQKIVEPNQKNNIDIFNKALLLKPKKIIIKNPKKGYIIKPTKVNSQIVGSRNRFDIYTDNQEGI